eukprot:m.49834 g.49834  ORF g.49834 m.49834 type:complete len:62 (+) comp12106_c0_seq2:294-479(+)
MPCLPAKQGTPHGPHLDTVHSSRTNTNATSSLPMPSRPVLRARVGELLCVVKLLWSDRPNR